MGTYNQNLTVQKLFSILTKTGAKMSFATAYFFKAEPFEDSVNAAKIKVGMTVNEMDMHNFLSLLTIDNHSTKFFCKDNKLYLKSYL